ncbi:hypothetical protein [Sandaracinus amylolyticus]|uniref:Uncharacterized protein n=1 Tax=Sandaracinus amylolyticus TaxID=927083 RepID=A0A0F6SEE1_9BACT|nr:hypothetical protein [Sandaracinus amylolyticus]AKF05034.1 hypothetical protein DB32_002183 [Sandaracinus amylolyticus]
MPRKLGSDESLDSLEDEILFTRAALEADEDAADLLTRSDDWLSLVDAARARDRSARIAEASASALRAVANGRLDDACADFGRRLALEAPRSSARWTRFFDTAPSAWVARALSRQVASVKAWLTISGDALLDAHRAPLARWSDAAQAALDRTAASAQVRGAARVGREELALDLTRERDGLHAALVARAAERGLPRDWPARFFRIEDRRRRRADEDPAPAPA